MDRYGWQDEAYQSWLRAGRVGLIIAIMTIVQYMCGTSDEIRKITIEASDDQGKPYKIIIL
jgi:hypothetical protein